MRNATQLRHQAADTWSALNYETDPKERVRLNVRLAELQRQYNELTGKYVEFNG